MDTEAKTITFYGKSDAFGAAKLENIKKCVEAGKVFTDKNLTECIVRENTFFYKTDYELIPISY